MFSGNRNFPEYGSLGSLISDHYHLPPGETKQVGNKQLWVVAGENEANRFLTIRSYKTDIIRIDRTDLTLEFLVDDLVSTTTVAHLKGLLSFINDTSFSISTCRPRINNGSESYSCQSSLYMAGYTVPLVKGMKLGKWGEIVHIPGNVKLEVQTITMESTKDGRRANKKLRALFKPWDRMDALSWEVLEKFSDCAVADENIVTGYDLYEKVVEGLDIKVPDVPYLFVEGSSVNYLGWDEIIKRWYVQWRDKNCVYDTKDVTESTYAKHINSDLNWEQVYR